MPRRGLHPGRAAGGGQAGLEAVRGLRRPVSAGLHGATLLFEAGKLYCLGPRGYRLNCHQNLDFIRRLAMHDPEPFSLAVAPKRIDFFHFHFPLCLPCVPVAAAAGWYFFRKRLASVWSCLFFGLLLSSACGFIYWLCFSMAWSRYAVMAVGVTCFALSVPFFGLRRARQRVLYAVAVLMALSPALPRTPELLHTMRHATFRPSPRRIAREHVVSAIADLRRKGPVDLLSTSQYQYYEVDFQLDGAMNFNVPLGDPSYPAGDKPPRRIVFINRFWNDQIGPEHNARFHGEVERMAASPITSVLFCENIYELVEIGPATPRPSLPTNRPALSSLLRRIRYLPVRDFSGTELSWDSGGDTGCVTLSTLITPEETISNEARTTRRKIYDLNAGIAYEFRLYANKDRRKLLGWVRVTRKPQ